MKRAPAVGLFALGCALAAAAAGTGPYLTSRPVPETPVRELMRTAARERQRRRLLDQLPPQDDSVSWLTVVVDALLVAVFAAVVLYVLWRLLAVLRRIIRLRLNASAGSTHGGEYDPGDESHEDAVTALRKRVADELTALSADLDTAPDPREVVIACYARMEHAFAGAGSARRLDESPLELLRRVLNEQYVPEGDVRRLTALFTEARYSTHEITEEMRYDARHSLDNIAAALAVPA